jgi:hypothetical protein
MDTTTLVLAVAAAILLAVALWQGCRLLVGRCGGTWPCCC